MTLPRIISTLPRPYAPEINYFSMPFWRGLTEGRFLLKECEACNSLQFPPRPHCPTCLGDEPGWRAASGKGVLYASTRVHAAGARFASMTPYTVGIVDLAENVRVLTRLMHDASSLPPGSAVQLAVIDHTDGPLFVAVGA